MKESTALYGNYTTLAVSMYNLAIALITPISVAFMPVFARCRSEGDFHSFRGSVKDSLDITSVVASSLFNHNRELSEIIQKAYFSILNGENIASVRFAYDKATDEYWKRHMWDD